LTFSGLLVSSRTEVMSTFHFCPQCQFQMAPVCGRCFRGVQITDVYCTTCGHDLAEDRFHAEAVLQAAGENLHQLGQVVLQEGGRERERQEYAELWTSFFAVLNKAKAVN